MKLPFASSQNNINSSSIKHQLITTSGAIEPNQFEPKSVLDVRRSPSSQITGTTTAATTNNNNNNNNNIVFSLVEDQLPLENNNNTNSNSNSNTDHGVMHQFEEWDSLMKELGLHDDSSKSAYPLDLPELPPIHTETNNPATGLLFHSEFENLNPNMNALDFMSQDNDNDTDNNNGYDYVDDLIRIAECFETRSIQLAQVILTRLNQRLRAPNGKPLQRAAFYFKEALRSLLTGPTRPTQSPSGSEIVHAIKAYKTFSNVSPIPMFADFTANQAVLEAVDGAMIVHVIDFDIGYGEHLASLLKEIAEKADARKVHSPAVRITAVVSDEFETESKLIRDSLWQFARGLRLRFDIEFVLFRNFEYLSFKSIKFIDGEKTAVLLNSTIFHRIGAGFINDLRRISPHVIVCVDGEGLFGSEQSFFRQTVIDGLEFYSTLLESLEAANVGGGGGDWMRKIEMFVLLPRITAAVEASGRQVPLWREVFGRAGVRAVALSQFAEFQAECLLRRVQVRGFHVVKRQAEMVLCWHDRPLVSTSAWRF